MLLLLCLLSTLAVATGHYPDLKSCHAACDKTQACGEGVACKCDCCGAYGEDVEGCYCLAWCVVGKCFVFLTVDDAHPWPLYASRASTLGS